VHAAATAIERSAARPGSGWCLDPESNRDAAFQQAADFKSAVSTNFTIEASTPL
jgi:hypothetical protein